MAEKEVGPDIIGVSMFDSVCGGRTATNIILNASSGGFFPNKRVNTWNGK